MAYFVLHPVDAEDVQSVWDLFAEVVALGICASAGALTRKRFVLAIGVFVGFSVFFMLLLKLLTAVVGLHVWNSVPIVIMFGALTGAVAFSVVSRRPGILITGALAGVMGLMLTGLVSWAAWEIWPRKLTELEPATFAALIAFGPIMGLALGVPFAVVDKKAACDQNVRGTT
jgi:hypothetical protein